MGMTNIELEVAHSTNRKNRAVAEYFESQNEKTDSIDWEQRRYEIAKEMMPQIFNELDPEYMLVEGAKGKSPMEVTAESAVRYADALIEELKKERIKRV